MQLAGEVEETDAAVQRAIARSMQANSEGKKIQEMMARLVYPGGISNMFGMLARLCIAYEQKMSVCLHRLWFGCVHTRA